MRGRVRSRDDRGATLILVLIIVTVVALVMGAVLLYADTNLSSTVALRSQTGKTYSVDAAGNAYLAQLKNGDAQCADQNGTTSHLGSAATPFYSPTGSANAVNATIVCTPDIDDGLVQQKLVTKSGHGVAISSANLPGYALLALYQNSVSDGIITNGDVCVLNGRVASNGVIDAQTANFGVRAGDCTSGGGGLTLRAHGTTGSNGCVSGTGTFSPTGCTPLTNTISEPAQPAPSDPIPAMTPAPVCDPSGTYAAFQPGLYTDVSTLNSPCGGLPAQFEWFSPGTYYFDYGDTWTWPTTLVAGTPTSGPTTDNSDGKPVTPALTAIDPAQASTLAGLAQANLPNACADPAVQKDYRGVQFVFGGSSRVVATGGSAQICASYSDSSAPTAIYGAPNTVNVTGGSVPGQSLCTPAAAPTTCTDPLLQFDGAEVRVNGYVYAPAGAVTVAAPSDNMFNWGAALLTLGVTGSASSPLAQLPTTNAGYTETTTTITIRTYKYVDVWVCPASSTPCSTTGTPDLRIKAQYEDDGGKVTVLSWSTQS
jgi:hypothetical protein